MNAGTIGHSHAFVKHGERQSSFFLRQSVLSYNQRGCGMPTTRSTARYRVTSMPVTDRMLIGAIAGNPASFEGTGEYRFCRTCDAIFFTSASEPDPTHDGHDWFALPSLNPDGSNKLSVAFRRYITRWSPERQEELERFALKKGWDMAMELQY